MQSSLHIFQNIKTVVPVCLIIRYNFSGTYKLKKVAIQKQGFDPDVIKDKMYFVDAKKKAYVPLTQDIYAKIVSGEIRV